MKKIIVIAAIAAGFALAFGSCGGAKSLKTEKDSLAYALGLDIGMGLKTTLKDSTLNVNLIAAGIKEAFANEMGMTREDATKFLQEYMYVRVPARAKAAGEEFLADVEKKTPNIQKTESGLMYVVENEGDMSRRAMVDQDVVRVIYHGELKDGKVFDSSLERGDTVEFPLNRVIKGWTEGMKLVGPGGKIKLYIPSDLGYGEQGQPYGGIGANEPLVFDVTLVDVKPAAEAPKK